MAKKIRTYVVADGCIQEGSEVFVKGELYTPPTVALEKELLEAGLIALPAELVGPAGPSIIGTAPVIPTPLVAIDGTQDAGSDTGAGDGSAVADADLLNQGQ